MLRAGGLSTRRNRKTFAWTHVNISSEQVVNADVASRKVGITLFTMPEKGGRFSNK